MYKYNGKVIRAGRSWTDNSGVTYPTSWMKLSEEEKTALGLVWEDDSLPFDNRYYWNADTPKALEDVNATDEDGNPLLDENGEQVVTLGLKSQAIARAKQQAEGELAATDWMVVKSVEVAEYSVPAEVTTARAAIRQASNDKEASILACTTLEEFIAFENPVAEV